MRRARPLARPGLRQTDASFGLRADADEADFTEAVDALHQVAVRRVADVARSVEAEAEAAPTGGMREAPLRSGGRSESGGADGGDGGEREHGLADHDVLLGCWLLWIAPFAQVVAPATPWVHDTMCQQDLTAVQPCRCT